MHTESESQNRAQACAVWGSEELQNQQEPKPLTLPYKKE